MYVRQRVSCENDKRAGGGGGVFDDTRGGTWSLKAMVSPLLVCVCVVVPLAPHEIRCYHTTWILFSFLFLCFFIVQVLYTATTTIATPFSKVADDSASNVRLGTQPILRVKYNGTLPAALAVPPRAWK